VQKLRQRVDQRLVRRERVELRAERAAISKCTRMTDAVAHPRFQVKIRNNAATAACLGQWATL